MDLEKFLSNSYNTQNFEQFISDKFYGFEPLNSQAEDEELSESEKKHIQNYRFLGQAELDDGSEIGFFEFVSASPNIENKRVGFSNVLKKLAKEYLLDGAIASFFHSKSNAWRLSFVGFEYDEGKANVTNLKRYTYVLGENIPHKTAFSQLKKIKYPKYEEIEEAFSVEAITKEFYTQYKALFEDINEELESQKALFSDAKENPEVEIRKFSRKLLGRITFLYFLQKKGWLGVKDEWGDGDKNFLQKTFFNSKGNFYLKILTPLFFTALNTQRNDSYFELLDCKIPFLNGGLFTKESYDSDRVILSNELFKKIFEIFNQYNFTIIEDLPHDSEVAIDPEMLGRVFENLIEENYRKGKGAFYTPREIVHYMCQESIIMFLSNNFEKEYIENLVKSGVADNSYIKSNANKIKKNILSIKVLDPAIGSGAFPMGMLHEIMHVLSNIGESQNNSKEKKEIIENSIFGIDIDASAVDIAKLRFWLSIIVDEDKPFPLPNLAFKIMQGNSLIETIDGIDPIPAEIDEPKTKKEQKQLFGKIHQAWDFDKTDAHDYITVLRKKLHQFFDCNKINQKENIQKEIFSLIKQILEQKTDELKNQINTLKNNLATEQLKTNSQSVEKKVKKITDDIYKKESTLSKINTLKDKPINDELFLYKLWFGEILKNGGFDVVIGNPPYLRVQNIDKEVSEQYKKLFQAATGSYDLYILFVEKGLSLLSKNGVLNFIMPHLWTNSAYGKGLRLSVNNHINKLISFDAYQVFNASTYTSLLWIKKEKSKTLLYNELSHDVKNNVELKKYLDALTDESFTNISTQDLNEEPWVLTDKKTYEILKILKTQQRSVKDVFLRIFQGLKTSADNIYILHNCKIDTEFVKGYSEYLEKEICVEKGLVKPVLKGNSIHRYETLDTDKYVIFPYKFCEKNGVKKAELFLEEELFLNFPMGLRYLKSCELELKNRQKGLLKNDDFWFKYIYPKNLVLFENKKIMLGEISFGGSFTVDDAGIYHVGQYSMLKSPDVKESYKFFITILNSKICWFFMKNTASVLSGGYYTYRPNYLNPFPLPTIIDFDITKPFEILADYIMWLKTKENIDDYVDNKYIAKLFEDIIDAMVLELYFEKELIDADFNFINYAQKEFKVIDGLSDSKIKNIILDTYKKVSEKDNQIRNDLQLLPIKVPLIAPILESI